MEAGGTARLIHYGPWSAVLQGLTFVVLMPPA